MRWRFLAATCMRGAVSRRRAAALPITSPNGTAAVGALWGRVWTADGSAADRIARWNGSSWTGLGSGMNDIVYALAVSGSDLYAGGYFTNAGGSAANYIARWDGSSWSPLGSGMAGGFIFPPFV